MNDGLIEDVSDGLRVCTDRLAFTLRDVSDPADTVQLLGMDNSDFTSLPRDVHSYSFRIRCSSLAVDVLYGGRDDTDVHVIIAGSVIHDVLVFYADFHTEQTPFRDVSMDINDFNATILRGFLKEVSHLGQVARLDLTVNDIGGLYYSMSDVWRCLSSDLMASKFRGRRDVTSHVGALSNGNTIYTGNAQSAIMLHIYDKQTEQNSKFSRDGQPLINTPWVRWEVGLKKEHTHKACISLVSGLPVQNISIGTLMNYLRFIVDDNLRIGRYSTEPVWESFCNGIRKLPLYVPTPPKTIDDIKRWLLSQISVSLANVMINDGGDTAFVYSMLETGIIKLGKHNRSAVEFMGDVI